MDLVGDLDERLAHREPSCLEVEVLPPKSEYLAASHAGVGGKVERRVEAVQAHRIEEGGELLRIPRLDLGLAGGLR